MFTSMYMLFWLLLALFLISLASLYNKHRRKHQRIKVAETKHRIVKTSWPRKMEMYLDDQDQVYFNDREERVRQYLQENFDQDILDFFPEYTMPKYQVVDYMRDIDPGFAFDNIVQRSDPDAQNVHDTNIQKTLKAKYKDSKKSSDVSKELDEIKKHIATKPDSERILGLLDKIEQRNSPMSNFQGDTEIEILANVWKSGDSNVKDFILEEIKNSESTRGDIVCPTGVASRIVNASFINDPDKMPKTREMLMEEMMNTAINVRNKIGDDDANFKEQLLDTYYTDYKETMSKEDVDECVKDWIDHI